MRRPSQDDRCSLGLSTMGWTTHHQVGPASRVLRTVGAVHNLVDATGAGWVTRVGA